MLYVIVLGLAGGAAVQAWRAWPAQSVVGPEPLAVVFCAGLVLAYYAGRRSMRGRGNATATAIASSTADAVATNSTQINLAVFATADDSDRAAYGGVRVPTSAAPWMSSAPTAPRIELDQLEGQDLDDLLDARDSERQFD